MRVILSGSVHQWVTTLDARGQDIFFPAKEASKSIRGGLGYLKCLLFVFTETQTNCMSILETAHVVATQLLTRKTRFYK